MENPARRSPGVTRGALDVWGASRVGVHLNLRGDSHAMGDSNPAATFGYVGTELGRRKIAFLFCRESLTEPRIGPVVRKAFGGVYVANDQLTRESAEQLLASGEAD